MTPVTTRGKSAGKHRPGLRRRIVGVVALLTTAPLLSACFQFPAPSGAPTAPEPDEIPSSTAAPEEPTTTTTESKPLPTEIVDLSPGQPATAVNFFIGKPVFELRVLAYRGGLGPASPESRCDEPEWGQYMSIEVEYKILPALSEWGDTYSTRTIEFYGETPDGKMYQSSNPIGVDLWCFGEPAGSLMSVKMAPGETYQGYFLLDVPEDTTAIIWEAQAEYDDPSYRWNLADLPETVGLS